MADRFSKEIRSRMMSRIRGKETAPELALRKALWGMGLRYRKHFRAVPGRPDIAFPSRRLAIFVDGCFWHRCPLHATRPSSNEAFWDTKLAKNQERDRRNEKALHDIGWTFLRFWEHEVQENADACARQVHAALLAKPQKKRGKDS